MWAAMTPDHPAKKYHKSEILALCQTCQNRDGMNCIITDIESSRAEYLPLPGCMKTGTPNQDTGTPHEENRNTQSRNRDTTLKNDQKTANNKRCPDSVIPMKKTETPCPEKTGTLQYIQLPSGKLKIKEIDLQILELLKEK